MSTIDLTIPEARVPDREGRQRLLESAAEIFARKGYAAATVREIVTSARVTPPVLYYHFGNKEGLFLALTKDAWDRFDAVVEEALAEGGSARERFLRLSERVFSLFRERIGTARVLYSVNYGPRERAPHFDFDAYHERFRQVVKHLVEEGIRAGELRPGDPEATMWALLGAVNIAMEVELCHPELTFGREGLRRVLEAIFRGVASPRGKERRT
ncbi:MAG: TetR/AcrR family transcriptional regulator [Deltaproteobacteria bacterium]|nr:TetR/AcrR family transcriptional regulator [Deltaproteobacteria bacterium]